MTYKELIRAVSKETGMSEVKVTKVFDSMRSTVYQNTKQGKKTVFLKLGTFLLGHKSEKRGRNPITGEIIVNPPMVIARFKASENYKQYVREGR